MATKRLFIAAEPPQHVVDGCRDVIEKLKGAGDGIRWVKPHGIHLTVKFFGNVDESRIPEISDAAGVLSGSGAIDLAVGGLGTFPGKKRPRVIWIGITGDLDRLVTARDMLDGALSGIGFPREDRPFRAHLTLGRVKERIPVALVSRLEQSRDISLGAMRVEGFSLIQSDLKPSGAVYTPLAFYSLT
ncbi:MAG: RNA 2',3'-cyclic phosphodiesterase [Deltaproteobacteria bacterium]|nr:RNA 2',3'-cyclic phosphodiesterase [Candidatus Zymogenaceae bacterium]